MSTLTKLEGKKVLVFGLGLHGGAVSVAQWLVGQGATVTVTDRRSSLILRPSLRKLRGLGIRFELGSHSRAVVASSDIIVKNPGVPINSPYLMFARKQGIPIVTDISLFIERTPSPLFAITGTKGKTTTTRMLYDMVLRRWPHSVLAGNPGLSPLTLLKGIRRQDPTVIELSSWQLEDLSFFRLKPHLAVITNLFPDHLNTHGTMAGYAKAKSVIFSRQTKKDFTILNFDNKLTRSLAKKAGGTVVWFSLHPLERERACFIRDNTVVCRSKKIEQAICPVDAIRVPGSHNRENALAAVTAAYTVGVPVKYIASALSHFRGVAGRQELVTVKNGVRFINDTTATNPESAVAALETISGRIILIAGGADKKLPYANFVREIVRKVGCLILLPGTATAKISALLRKRKFPHSFARSMDHAVKLASARAKKGDTVILSPGSASFGLFLHEFDRGRQFVAAVKKL